MTSMTSWLGANRMRCLSARSTMTSAKGPSGLCSQRPTTSRVPDVVPTPAMRPSKRRRETMLTTAGGARHG